jgi:hypothetical protein
MTSPVQGEHMTGEGRVNMGMLWQTCTGSQLEVAPSTTTEQGTYKPQQAVTAAGVALQGLGFCCAGLRDKSTHIFSHDA